MVMKMRSHNITETLCLLIIECFAVHLMVWGRCWHKTLIYAPASYMSICVISPTFLSHLSFLLTGHILILRLMFEYTGDLLIMSRVTSTSRSTISLMCWKAIGVCVHDNYDVITVTDCIALKSIFSLVKFSWLVHGVAPGVCGIATYRRDCVDVLLLAT